MLPNHLWPFSSWSLVKKNKKLVAAHWNAHHEVQRDVGVPTFMSRLKRVDSVHVVFSGGALASKTEEHNQEVTPCPQYSCEDAWIPASGSEYQCWELLEVYRCLRDSFQCLWPCCGPPAQSPPLLPNQVQTEGSANWKVGASLFDWTSCTLMCNELVCCFSGLSGTF